MVPGVATGEMSELSVVPAETGVWQEGAKGKVSQLRCVHWVILKQCAEGGRACTQHVFRSGRQRHRPFDPDQMLATCKSTARLNTLLIRKLPWQKKGLQIMIFFFFSSEFNFNFHN